MVDLTSLVGEEWDDITYQTNIKAKQKCIEGFNAELTKLLNNRDNTQIKQKDYTSIFNTIQHMIEEKNMLVFVEAIFTIEQLANLLGNNFKPATKVKALLTLVAGKYCETKTAVIAAVDKCISAMVKSGAIAEKAFADLMINHIVASHKNPRVK